MYFLFLKLIIYNDAMIQLEENKGIPRSILIMMSVVAGLTVANLYYNQPLLEEMKASLGANEVETNLITVITQAGYAAGLLFVVPLADMLSRRKIIMTNMATAVLMALVIACTADIKVVWAASFILGMCSVVPQIFVPMAGLFSKPENKSRNMGYVLSGLLTGVLGARVISGYLGDWVGWRAMYGIAAAIMLICLAVTLKMLPVMRPSFKGSYPQLMRTVGEIFFSHPNIRLYSLRASCSFASMMSIWSCMAFHLSGSPFNAGSDKVGLLGLCGIAGAMAASGVGKYIPRFGILRFSTFGSVFQLLAWGIAFLFGVFYAGLALAIILVDIGAQCQQLSNQSGCLKEVPHASNRANTIFMTSLFIGGSVGTFCSGAIWPHWGWHGVCCVGILFATLSLIISAYERLHR